MAENPDYSPLAVVGFGIALVAVLAEVLAGVGTRWHWWDFRTGLAVFRWAAYGGLLGGAISLAGCLVTFAGRHQGFLFALIGLLIGVVAVGVPWHYWRVAQRVPAIHDITTDPEDPPQFVAVLPLRRGLNPATYGGPEIAARQRAAYPEIVPLALPLPPAQAFPLALSAARAQGWQIVVAEPASGRIEASDRTFWFGFTDDIVVRITARGQGSRIDVRSSSRVGKSDLGMNAGRIERYLEKVREAAKQ